MVSSKDTGRVNKRSKKLDLAATIMSNSAATEKQPEETSTDKVLVNIEKELKEQKEEVAVTEPEKETTKKAEVATPVVDKPAKPKQTSVKSTDIKEAPFGLKKDGTPRRKPGRRSENEGEVVRLAVNISEELYNDMRPALFAHQNNLTMYIKNLIINDLKANGAQYDKIVEMMAPTLKYK